MKKRLPRGSQAFPDPIEWDWNFYSHQKMISEWHYYHTYKRSKVFALITAASLIYIRVIFWRIPQGLAWNDSSGSETQIKIHSNFPTVQRNQLGMAYVLFMG